MFHWQRLRAAACKLPRYAAGMELTVVWYIVAGVLILIGLAGTVLPVLPGVPIMYAGMLLAAWAGHFQKIPIWVMVILGILAAFSIVFDFLAGTFGARRHSASKTAVWGALIGTIVGIFFGVPGLLLGPFIGAVIGQLVSGSRMEHAAKVGFGTWIGLLIGTAIKLAVAFMMLGTFVLALAF